MALSSKSLYKEISKIDAHIHQNVGRTAILDAAKDDGFQLVSINTEIPDFPDTGKQREVICRLNETEKQPVNFIATFTTEHWGETGWQNEAIAQIKEGLEKGAIAVKIWKNIGMELQDNDGNYVMADHSSFDPIYEFLVDREIPLAAHLGEPKNCWLPVEKMTVESDKDYFSKHPEYHMYHQKHVPGYKEHLTARDNILRKYPNLNFIGLHLASHEWSVDKVAEWLDNFPQAAVDLAERVCHLQYQCINNHQKVKSFVEEYKDRIIYGSDQIDDGSLEPDEIQKIIRRKWHEEFNFFASGDTQSAWNVPHLFKGLGLQKEILEKIFHDNALKYYPRFQTNT